MTVLGATAAVLAPADAVQGQWQRLMYLHVPAAWTAYLAFAAVLVASAVRLRAPRRGTVRRRGTRAERCAQAAAEVGVVATTVTLVSGSIWGHAVWGVWWTWDARLTSTALMLFVYIGYLGLLGSPGRADTAARRASWLGVGGFVIVPVVHFSVVWWHTLHQKATVLAPPTSVPPIDPRMAVALALCVVAATALAVWAFALRLPALRPPTRDGEDGTALTAAAAGIQQTTVVPAAWADAGSREQLARR
jgi:heme exporter protein C